MTRPLVGALTSFLGLFLASLAPAQRPAPAALSGSDVFQRTLKSVTWIIQAEEATGGRVRISSGSGSLIDVAGRLVLTNHHVVGESRKVAVFFPQFDKQKKVITDRDYYFQQLRGGKDVLEGEVIARDSKRDLAIIKLPKLPAGTTALRMAKDSVAPGDNVHSLGNPGASGALWAYTNGYVKQVYKNRWTVLDREDKSEHHYEAQVVETTSPVNPGDSGGPLLNSAGELAAVTQGGVVSQGTISFFVDISEVRALLAAKKIRITNAPASDTTTTVADTKTEAKADAKAPAAAKKTEASDQEKQEKEADRKLQLAKDLLKDRPDRAKDRLEEIVKNYPKTKAATEAKELLAKLKK